MFGFAKKLVKQAEGIIAPEIQSTSPSYGFRVLYVEPDSEAFHAGVEPLFDFVVAVNGTRFDRAYRPNNGQGGHVSIEQEQSPSEDLEAVVQATQGKLLLELWCAKGRSTRIVTLPNPIKQANGIGLTLQWSPLSVADHVWHILNVVPNSPADTAGLVSHADYIIAGENGVLEEGGEHVLSRAVSRASPSEGILFYVYNRDFNLVRPVRVFPSHDGKLGCGVGYGLLHSLPKVSKSDSRATPGSMVFDDDEQEVDATYLDSSVASKIPAPPAAPMPTSSVDAATLVAPPPRAHAHHNVHHQKPSAQATGQLASYFEEQSQISKQIDGSHNAKGSAAPPPPPKASS